MKIRLCSAGSILRSADIPGGGMHPSLYEILHIIAGKVRFRWMSNVCDAEAPAVFIMSISTPHQLESLHSEAKFRFIELAELENFPFTDKQIDQWNFMQARKDVYSKILLAASIVQSLDFVYHLQSTGAAHQDPNLEEVCLLEIQKTYKLIAHILNSSVKGMPSNVKIKRKPRRMADLLIDYMDSHYRENITLKTLAELVHLHPSYLVRMFKKQTKTTPFDYLRDLRLKAAVRYLSVSEMRISNIIDETGFKSVHYFTRLFKEAYGQSPAEWRKQLRRLDKTQ